jgi:glycosyltransferase involved in cell wall biosynthesis
MLLPADKSGCGLYRMLIPGREVAKSGDHKVYFGGGVYGRVERDDEGRPKLVYLPPLNVDVIVFQRPFDSIVKQVIPLAKAQGVATVVELDDDVRAVDPMNFSHEKIHPRLSPLSNWQNVVDACRIADWVTVSTPPLKCYAPHGRVSVVRNTLPPSVLTVPDREPHDPMVVTWPGAVTTHPRDLQECGRGVASALKSTGATFAVVGDGANVKENLKLDFEPHATGWLELPDYPETLKATADVGIVPLAPTQFNRAKSSLKGMEMAGLGIPFVASPLPEYRDLVNMGAGVLARNPYEWEVELTRILTDESHRVEMSQRGREVVREHLTIDKVVDQWESAWRSARRYRDAHPVREAVAV